MLDWAKVVADPEYADNRHGRALFLAKLKKLLAKDKPLVSSKQVGEFVGLLSQGHRQFRRYGAMLKKYEK